VLPSHDSLSKLNLPQKGQNSVADNNDSLRFQAIIRHTLGGGASTGRRMQIQMIGQPRIPAYEQQSGKSQLQGGAQQAKATPPRLGGMSRRHCDWRLLLRACSCRKKPSAWHSWLITERNCLVERVCLSGYDRPTRTPTPCSDLSAAFEADLTCRR
jgi:hypothetical protein